MSFQRPLTGESTMIATVVLNTNICANTVSTVNLSATNASFTNITTNTYTLGNVSTPNLIATTEYISNSNISNLSVSTATISTLYALNTSITNLSGTLISVSNISSFMINSSTVSVSNLYVKNGYASNISITNTSVDKLTANNLSSTQINTCLIYVSNFNSSSIINRGVYYNTSLSAGSEYPTFSIKNYDVSYSGASRPGTRFDGENVSRMLFTFSDSTYNPMTLTYNGVSVTNLSVNASLSVSVVAASLMDIDGTITGNMGRFQFYELKNSGGNTIMTFEQPTINSSRIQLQIENSGITGYDVTRLGVSILTMNTSGSTFYSPLSVSSLTTSTLNTSNFAVTNLSVSNLSVSNLSASKINTNNLVASNTSISSLELGYELNYKTSGNGLLFNFNATAGSLGSVFYNALNTQTARHRFQYLDQDLMSINSSQILVYNPLNSSYRFSVSYMSVSSLNVCGSDSATIYTSGLTLRNFSIDPTTLHMAYPTNLQLNTVFNTAGVATEYYGMRLTTDLNDAVVEISPYLDFAVTHSGVSAIEHIRTTATSRRWNIYSDVYNVCNTCLTSVSASNASIDNLSVTNLTATNFAPSTITSTNISVSSLSVSVALTAVSGTLTTLNSTSAFITNLSTSNVSVSGRITTTNLCVTSVSATGRINGDTIRGTTWIISAGNISGVDVFGSTVNTCNIFCSQQINTSMVSCREVSTSMIYTSNTSFRNASADNASITTLSGTTAKFTNGNFSTLAVSNPVVDLTVSNLYCSAIGFYTNGGVSQYGNVQLAGSKMYIGSQGLAATAIQMGNSGNVRFEISQNGVSSYVGFYASTGNFSTLNSSTFSPANITTTTMTATTVNGGTGNFSTLNASTWNLPTTLSTTTVNANTGNFSTLSASTWNLPSTLTVTTVTASNGNFSTLSVSTFSPANITTTTIGAITGNFSTLNASTWTLPLTITTTTVTASTGNFSTLSVSTFSPANITTTTVGATTGNFSTVNASLGNVCNISVSTITGSTITVAATTVNSAGTFNISVLNCSSSNISYTLPANVNFSSVNACSCNICNISTSYISTYDFKSNLATIGALYPDLLILKSPYDSPSMSWSTSQSGAGGRLGADFANKLCDLTVYSYNLSYFNITAPDTYVNVSSWNFCNNNGSFVGGVDINSCRFYISNISVSNMSISTALTIPNTVSANTSNISLKLHLGSTNTSSSGIQVPNYIDGLDTTTGLFIGYNHTGGFVNFSRTIRSFANITLDGNLNQITTTNNLGIGRNLTTGSLLIGDTGMTGNVCINTSGNIVLGNVSQTGVVQVNNASIFEVNSLNISKAGALVSTWNPSNMVLFSNQIGSWYGTAIVNSSTKTTTAGQYVFSPLTGNIAGGLQTVPVGTYMVMMNGTISTYSNVSGNFNGTISSWGMGIATGTTLPMTSANTTRTTLFTTPQPDTTMTNTSSARSIAAQGMINITATGNYLAGWVFLNLSTAATAGLADFRMNSIYILRVA